MIDGKTEFKVTNVQAYGGYILHTGYIEEGSLSVLDEVISEYDEVRVRYCLLVGELADPK